MGNVATTTTRSAAPPLVDVLPHDLLVYWCRRALDDEERGELDRGLMRLRRARRLALTCRTLRDIVMRMDGVSRETHWQRASARVERMASQLAAVVHPLPHTLVADARLMIDSPSKLHRFRFMAWLYERPRSDLTRRVKNDWLASVIRTSLLPPHIWQHAVDYDASYGTGTNIHLSPGHVPWLSDRGVDLTLLPSSINERMYRVMLAWHVQEDDVREELDALSTYGALVASLLCVWLRTCYAPAEYRHALSRIIMRCLDEEKMRDEETGRRSCVVQ